MRRTVFVVPVLAACWSSNANKDLERRVEALSAELAKTQAEHGALERRVNRLAGARDLESRIDEITKKLDVIASRPVAPPARPSRPQPDPTKVYAVPLGAAHVAGPADAKITLVAAREYACPFCEKSRSTLVELRKKYGKELRIVYKQLVVHPRTATAPALAICAATKQGKHDQLDLLLWDKGFHQRSYDTDTTLPDGTTQACWTTTDGCPVVLGFAQEAGLDLARFKRDMAGACVTELADTARELAALGVSATPSFFINGRYLSGAMPIERFAAIIDEEARKADERLQRGTKRARYYQEWVVDRGERTLAP